MAIRNSPGCGCCGCKSGFLADDFDVTSDNGIQTITSKTLLAMQDITFMVDFSNVNSLVIPRTKTLKWEDDSQNLLLEIEITVRSNSALTRAGNEGTSDPNLERDGEWFTQFDGATNIAPKFGEITIRGLAVGSVEETFLCSLIEERLTVSFYDDVFLISCLDWERMLALDPSVFIIEHNSQSKYSQPFLEGSLDTWKEDGSFAASDMLVLKRDPLHQTVSTKAKFSVTFDSNDGYQINNVGFLETESLKSIGVPRIPYDPTLDETVKRKGCIEPPEANVLVETSERPLHLEVECEIPSNSSSLVIIEPMFAARDESDVTVVYGAKNGMNGGATLFAVLTEWQVSGELDNSTVPPTVVDPWDATLVSLTKGFLRTGRTASPSFFSDVIEDTLDRGQPDPFQVWPFQDYQTPPLPFFYITFEAKLTKNALNQELELSLDVIVQWRQFAIDENWEEVLQTHVPTRSGGTYSFSSNAFFPIQLPRKANGNSVTKGVNRQITSQLRSVNLSWPAKSLNATSLQEIDEFPELTFTAAEVDGFAAFEIYRTFDDVEAEPIVRQDVFPQYEDSLQNGFRYRGVNVREHAMQGMVVKVRPQRWFANAAS